MRGEQIRSVGEIRLTDINTENLCVDPTGRAGNTCVIRGEIHDDAERLPRSKGQGMLPWKSAEGIVGAIRRPEH